MVIETERLILRPINPETDFEEWARTMAHEEVVRYTTGKVMSRSEAWRHMAGMIGHWSIRGYGFFSVEEKSSGKWVGRVGPYNPEGWPSPEVGWTIHFDHWGKGFATEAGRAAIDYALDGLGWDKVSHVILDGNAASIAVAEKLGSKFSHSQHGIPDFTEGFVHIFSQVSGS